MAHMGHFQAAACSGNASCWVGLGRVRPHAAVGTTRWAFLFVPSLGHSPVGVASVACVQARIESRLDGGLRGRVDGLVLHPPVFGPHGVWTCRGCGFHGRVHAVDDFCSLAVARHVDGGRVASHRGLSIPHLVDGQPRPPSVRPSRVLGQPQPTVRVVLAPARAARDVVCRPL